MYVVLSWFNRFIELHLADVIVVFVDVCVVWLLFFVVWEVPWRDGQVLHFMCCQLLKVSVKLVVMKQPIHIALDGYVVHVFVTLGWRCPTSLQRLADIFAHWNFISFFLLFSPSRVILYRSKK